MLKITKSRHWLRSRNNAPIVFVWCIATIASVFTATIEHDPAFAKATPATINVADYGAVPNDGRDDAAAINAAIATAKSGDTVAFAAGTYNLSSQVNLQSGRKLRGVHGKTIILAPAGAQAFKVSGGSDADLADFNFNGGALYVDGRSKILFVGNDITNFDNSGDIGCGRGAFGGTGAQLDTGSYVARNDFHDSPKGRSCYFFTAFNTVFEDNAFRNVFLGIKSNNANIARTQNLTIQRCYFTLNDYHPVELQGCADGFWYLDNFFENPVDNPDKTSHFTGGSIIYTPGKAADPGGAGRSSNQHVLRNTVIGSTKFPLAIEMGCDVECRDNYLLNAANMAFNFYGGGGICQDNRIVGIGAGGIGYNYGGGTTPFANNGPTVQLTWNTARAKPGPAQAITGGTEDPQGLAIKPTVTVTGKNTLAVTWPAVTNATGYTVSFRTTGGAASGEAWKSIGTITTPSVNVEGLHGYWQYDVQVTAIGATGTGQVTGTRMGGTQADAEDASQPNSPRIATPTTGPSTPVQTDFDIVIPVRKGVYGMPTTRAA